MARQLGLLVIVVGIALLLSGFGFAILAIGGARRRPESPMDAAADKRTPKAAGPSVVLPTAPQQQALPARHRLQRGSRPRRHRLRAALARAECPPDLPGGVAFAAVDATAKLERILGPGWETMTSRQVEERARELERVLNFAWSLVHRMYEQHASTAGAVLQPNDHQSAE
jgi:hypothetical protein